MAVIFTDADIVEMHREIGRIVRAAAGPEICAAIDAGQREAANWTDEQRIAWIMEGIAP